MGSEPILEGRDAALEVLREALAQAARGRGRVVVVTGDAGIGKSTLAAALAGQAEASGAEVVWGRAWEFAEAPPYFPVRAALRGLGIDPHEATFREEGGAFRLWESVVEALASAGSRAPRVWILEDLHAADLLTLDLLTFLAQAARGLPVLVVGTSRPRDPRLDSRGSQRLSRMARDGIDLRLGPLSVAEVGAVAERLCGGALAGSIVDRLAELTGGNPLFVVECARAFRATGSLEALPPTVRHVVLERFEALPASTRTALTFGAVVGREFSAARVARMQAQLPARVIDDVLPALRSGLLDELEPGRFVFSHVVVRDAVEESVAAEERARIHGLAEAALANAGDAVEVVVERARHALEALSLAPPGVPGAAVGAGAGGRAPLDAGHGVALARRAIRLLEEGGAHDRACALFERLLAAAESAPVAATLTLEDSMSYATIARAAGRHTESRRACDRVLAAARESGDVVTFARAALVAAADIRPAVVDRNLVGLLREAQAMITSVDPALACRVEARLAAALQPHEDFEVPIAMARAAIARARAIPGLDEGVLLDVIDTGVAALVDYAPVDERLRAYDEIAARASARQDRPRVLRAEARRAMDHAFIGDFEAFSRDVDALLRLGSELGHPRYRWRPLLFSSMRAMSRGDFAESERAIVEVSQLATLTDDPSLAVSLHAHRYARAMMLQREDELRAIAADMPRTFAAVGDWMLQGFRTWLFARIGDEAQTRAGLGALGPVPLDYFLRETVGAGNFAETFALVGTDEQRRHVRSLLAPYPHHELIGGHMPISHDGSVLRSLAILDASLGDVASAERLLAEAIERAAGRGHRAWVAQMELDLARVTADGARARRAAALASELGMDGLASVAERFAEGVSSSAGAPPAGSRPSAPSRPSRPVALARPSLSLTCEGEVWLLVHGERSVRMKDSRGLRLLARLVERADEEVHVLALVADDGGPGLEEASAGDAVDATALRAYRDRLRDLGAQIDAAERDADLGKLPGLRRESARLEAEVARAVGLGGRARKEGSATERARVNVQRRLKDAVARVTDAEPAIGRFLERAVRTGTFCCFRA